ncbi:lipid asymmetry maintenance protein MlaB [Zoogloea sp.]|uniref:STAS domain-containing protein n=1 Tax=Zoogloea sp. TaxID=49181 RepID=UPI0035AE8201
MIREDGACLALEGPLTLATVAALAEAGRDLVAAADRSVDLSAVSQVDSSALALLLSWTRVARGAGRRLTIVGAPAPLVSLASLYDVDTILSFGR